MVEPEVAFADARRHDRARARTSSCSSSSASWPSTAGRARGARARSRSRSRPSPGPSPGITYDDIVPTAARRKGSADPNTATTSAPPRRRSSPSSRRTRSASPISRPRSRPSTCSPTRTGPTWPWASISWPPKATARSSAAASASTTWPSSKQRIREHNLPREAYEWYIDLRKYGSVPPLRVRPGRRADGVLDVRDQAHPRDHPLPAPALPDLSLTPRCRFPPSRSSPSVAPRTSSTARSWSATWPAPGIASSVDADQADIIILNTCGFIRPSRDEADEAIRAALAQKRGAGRRVDRGRLLRRAGPRASSRPAIPVSTPGSASRTSIRSSTSWPGRLIRSGRDVPLRP